MFSRLSIVFFQYLGPTIFWRNYWQKNSHCGNWGADFEVFARSVKISGFVAEKPHLMGAYPLREFREMCRIFADFRS